MTSSIFVHYTDASDNASADVLGTTKVDVTRERENLSVYSRFDQTFELDGGLGNGTDGIVSKYKHRVNGEVIAVKTQKTDTAKARQPILDEIVSFKIVGKHPYITGSDTECYDFQSVINIGSKESPSFVQVVGPAIFLEVADFGNLGEYYAHLQGQLVTRYRSRRTPEATIWKVFKDVVSGLKYIHNDLDRSYVHMDLKPENILVYAPQNYTPNGGIPSEPIFRISDFARLRPYPLKPGEVDKGWAGTLLYAAPYAERLTRPYTPALDMYSLGCTLQSIALNITPLESRKHFKERRTAEGKSYPKTEIEWEGKSGDGWFWRMQAIYRPLNECDEVIRTYWEPWEKDARDRMLDHQPYSDELNFWYSTLFARSDQRATSAELAKYLVPEIEDKFMPLARVLDRAQEQADIRDFSHYLTHHQYEPHPTVPELPPKAISDIRWLSSTEADTRVELSRARLFKNNSCDAIVTKVTRGQGVRLFMPGE